MQPGARRSRNNGIIASGSIWETRMKMGDVKGGMRVFNRQNKSKEDDGGIKVYQRLRRNQSDVSNVENRKRRNWKPPEPVMTNGVNVKNLIQLRKIKSELSSSSKICNGDKDKEEEAEEEDDDDDEIDIEGEIKSFDDKEIDLPLEKPKNIHKENEIHESNEIPIVPDIEPAVMEFKKNPIDEEMIEIASESSQIEAVEEMIEIASESQNKMQSIVDLVMWRDISRSGFVFGFGTFILLSSSYTKDLDFSLLSAISYLGLVYLALVFLYKSILRRGCVEFDEKEEKCIIGEEEAIWIVRFLLPYINEMLLNFKALFSGDPATTMKLALLLFAMARCGSAVTLSTLVKLVFFGVFTIPKVLSSNSLLLARYGKFWMERFRDGWESCSHKKAVAGAIFALIWNLSSTIARIWAVFMLVVAVKLYQQYAVDWINNNAEEVEEDCHEDSEAKET